MLVFGVLPALLSLVKVAAELLRGVLGIFGGVVGCIVRRFARFARGLVGLLLGVLFALSPRLFVVRIVAGHQRQ